MSVEVFHASNGIRLEIPGGWVVPEDRTLVQSDPSLLVEAHAEARAAGEPVGLMAQAATAAPRKRRNLADVSLASLATAALPEVRYAINPLIPLDGYVTLLGGHGGAGKSNLALAMAAHFAAGKPWNAMPTGRGAVLYVSLEDGAALVRYRLRRICDAYGLDHGAVIERLRVLDGSWGDTALAVEHAANGVRMLVPTEALEELADAAKGAELILVDNGSDAFAGDENNRRQVRQFMRMLADVGRDSGAGVVLLVHVDKSAARFSANRNSYSGSTAWHNSARSRLALVEREGRVELIQEKHNLGRSADPIPLHWSPSGVLMPSGLVAGRADAAQDDQAVLQALHDAVAQGVDVGAGRTGPATAQTVLATFPSLPARLRGRQGRDAFWSALGRLMNQGEVEAREVTTRSRHVRRVLVPVGSCADSCARNSPNTPCAEPAKPAQDCGSSLDAATSANTRNPRNGSAASVLS